MMQWTLHPVSRLKSAARAWDALGAQSGAVPFLRSDFLLAALAEFGSGRELLGICGPEAEPVAMGLFVRTRPGTWETFQPAQLPLGALVVRRGPGVEPLLHALIRALPGCALSVAVTQQDPAIRERPQESSKLATLDYVDTARVRLQGAFDGFWSARGKNLRQNVRKQFAKLRQDGIEPRLETVTDTGLVAAAIEQYGRLESAGWKAQEGTAVGADNAQGRFYRRVFEAFCATGDARIYRYWFAERVVAMDLCLIEGPLLVVLKTAYDESLRSISPASLLRHDYFRELFDEGRIRHVEFYGKVMDWHLRWTDDVRTLYHVNGYRFAWVRRLHAAIRRRGPVRAAEPADASGLREDRVQRVGHPGDIGRAQVLMAADLEHVRGPLESGIADERRR